jgi:hypothetical protein
MSKLLSLLLVILFTFDVALAAARSKPLKRRSTPVAIDISHLDTNAKRFAAGFPPLPPFQKKKPTNVHSTSTFLYL